MSARDWVILRFDSNRGGRGSLLRGAPFMGCPSVEEDDVGCVADASVIGDVVVCDAEKETGVADADADGGGISLGVAWNF